MFDWIVDTIAAYPYLGAALVFLLCGIGLPLPEEIVLIAAGYVCAKFPEHATLHWMMIWCAGAIMVGDLIPFVLGRVFGVRLLRLRWLRWLVTRKRLASFDRWFRRRGDLVILIARFLAGLRIVAFFTAGTMKMSWTRFVVLDGIGIVLMVPFLSLLGYHSVGFIEGLITIVQRVERGILYGILGGSLLVAASLWFWRRRKQQRRPPQPAEAFVQPQRPVHGESAPLPAASPPAAAVAEESPQLAEPKAPPGEALPAEPQAPSDTWQRPG